MNRIALRFISFAIIILIFCTLDVSAQSVSIDPPNLQLYVQDQPGVYEAQQPVYVGVQLDNWTITCTAEPLINLNGDGQISLDQIYIDHDLVSEFVPLNTTIDLGTGTSSDPGFESIINTLLFKVVTTGYENSGKYVGIVRFFNADVEVAMLTLTVQIDARFNFDVSASAANVVTLVPDIYSADRFIDLYFDTNQDNWHLEASIISSSAAQINDDNLFIRCDRSSFTGDDGAGVGYRLLGLNQTLFIVDQLVEQQFAARIEIKFRSNWHLPKGVHQATLQLLVPETQEFRLIELSIEVLEYNVMSLSETGVYFHANGPPRVWNGDKSTTLTIGSNSDFWSVVCEATDLTSPDDVIPRDRIFMKIDPDDFTGNEGAGTGFHSLQQQIEVADGTPTPPVEVCTMQFKLKTLDIDRPGHYEGVITFTYLSSP
ncbi:hypothetical protein JXB12_07255 [candidate division KSB1 bacterium]|nr:hypothetical protein [candidate division KSB1 bacterium]